MRNRFWAAMTVLAVSTTLVWSPSARPADRSDPPGKDVFGLTRLWNLELTIPAKDWEKMQPAGGPRFPGFPGAPEKPAEKNGDVHKGSTFGVEYPWVTGDLAAEGKTWKKVGLRFKGNFTYLSSANSLRRPLKIDIDRHDDKQRFHGLKKLNLNNGVTDPTRTIESLSYAVFRAAGVPAPRTALAQLTLTVPGKYDREFLGLYTLIEQVDKTFLKDRFKDGSGLLLKPEGLRGLEYLGEQWEPYQKRYQAKDEVSKKQQQRLIDFVRLVNKANDEQFRKEIGDYLDVDAFLRFLAANALLANLDSFLAFGHNYYLYLRPDTNRFVFIPWDVDLALGKWPPGGMQQQQAELSIRHPHAGENKLIDRLLAMKEVNEKYQKLLKELAGGCFSKERLLKDVDALEKAAREPLAREKKAADARREGVGGFGFGGPGGMFGQPMSPRTFVEKRTASIAAQIDGKSQGHVPAAWNFGGPPPGGGRPGGGFGAPPQPGQVLTPGQQDALRLTPEQRKRLEELQKKVDGQIGDILTDEQKQRLKQLREGPPRFGPPPGRP